MTTDPKFATCRVCGSAEMVAASTQECPGCGTPYPKEPLSSKEWQKGEYLPTGEQRTSNLVADLRSAHGDRTVAIGYLQNLFKRAADEIERLAAELAQWREMHGEKCFAEHVRLEAERDRLVAELAEASTSQLVQERIAQANLRLFAESQAELARLRANQAEAVRILSAIEFDGQAYAAIQRACKLLAGAAELNAALNIGQETGHAKRTADETTRCQHGRELAGCIECYRAELNGDAGLG